MAKKFVFLVVATSIAALTGCANLAGEVARRTDAPPWFKSRVKEIEGEGYPKFKEAKMTPRPRKSSAEWAEVKADLDSAKDRIDTDPRTINPGPLRDTMQWQAAAKQKTGQVGVEQ